jgi:hypothetical protein
MTDFATLTNPELNRWAAERDGYHDFYMQDRYCDGSEFVLCAFHNDRQDDAGKFPVELPTYADRADLAIGLLGRWGYEWSRVRTESGMSNYVEVYGNGDSQHHFESPDCDTARALVIAACSLKESEEG